MVVPVPFSSSCKFCSLDCVLFFVNTPANVPFFHDSLLKEKLATLFNGLKYTILTFIFPTAN